MGPACQGESGLTSTPNRFTPSLWCFCGQVFSLIFPYSRAHKLPGIAFLAIFEFLGALGGGRSGRGGGGYVRGSRIFGAKRRSFVPKSDPPKVGISHWDPFGWVPLAGPPPVSKKNLCAGPPAWLCIEPLLPSPSDPGQCV